MDNILKQQLLERMLLNMKYDSKKTLTENKKSLFEQDPKSTKGSEYTDSDKLKDYTQIDNLIDNTNTTTVTTSDDEFKKTTNYYTPIELEEVPVSPTPPIFGHLADGELSWLAKEWGFKCGAGLGSCYYSMYEKKEFDRLQREDMEKYLRSIGWPKWGRSNPIKQEELKKIRGYEFPPDLEPIQATTMPQGDYSQSDFDPPTDPDVPISCAYKEAYVKCKHLVPKQGYPISAVDFLNHWSLDDYCCNNSESYEYLLDKKFEVTHELLGTISLVTGILAPFTGPFMPILAGISLAADLADVKMYLNEGDPYMATIMGGFALIPGGELAGYFLKAGKTAKTLGKEGFEELAKKTIKNTATESERQTLKQAAKELVTDNAFVQGTIKYAKKLLPEIIQKILKWLITRPLKYICNFIIWLAKKGFGLSQIILQIGFIGFTFDQLYVALFHDNPEFMKVREDNEIQQIIQALKSMSNQDEIKQQLVTQLGEDLSSNKPENFEKLEQLDPNKISEQADSTYVIVAKETVEKINKIPEKERDEKVKSAVLTGLDDFKSTLGN